MPTQLFYEYRDYGNYQESETIIFPDDPTQERFDLINSNLLDGEYFIPSQVGLEDLQERLADGKPLGRDDHVEHSILKVGFSELTPTTDQLFADFATAFSTTKWDMIKAKDDHGLACDEAVSYLEKYIQ